MTKQQEDRAKALERDEYRCIVCGTTKDLHVHHSKYEDGTENLITLCRTHHKRWHVAIDYAGEINETVSVRLPLNLIKLAKQAAIMEDIKFSLWLRYAIKEKLSRGEGERPMT